MTKFQKLQKKKKKKKNRNSRDGKGNSFFDSFESFLFFRAPSTKFLINLFLILKSVFCHLNIETMGFPSPLKECWTSSPIKQYQFLLGTNSPWDTERLLCKSELGCSHKICSQEKLFADNLTNYIRGVKMIHVVLIFAVGYYCY